MKTLLLLAALGLAAASARADVIASWTFDSIPADANTSTGVTAPNVGVGTASALLVSTVSFSAGNGGGSDNSGWNFSGFATQGANSGTRGAEFLVDTTGFQDITLSFDHRGSTAASRWARLDYTLNGTDWTTGFWDNNGGLNTIDTYIGFSVDLTSLAGANNNPDFGIRLVSIFSPLAFDQNGSLADFGANAAYMRVNPEASYTPGGGTGTGNYTASGTWRFDNVTFSGAVIPEPSSLLLGLVAGLSLLVLRRK